MLLPQLDQGLDRDQVGKGIRLAAGDQLLLFPASKLALRETEFTPDIGAREFFVRGHAPILPCEHGTPAVYYDDAEAAAAAACSSRLFFSYRDRLLANGPGKGDQPASEPG